jgi:hypothetical protein
MMPGTWTVPQNPIEEGGEVALVKYKPKLGELMPAFFPIPENPLLNALDGCNGLGGGCGCGCGPRCQVGMGALDIGQSVTDWWEGLKVGNVSSILVAGAVVAGVWILYSGGRYKR